MVLLGLFGTLISVVLFVVASQSPGWGRALFATGQGLQGFYPLDYIQGMIVMDMSMQHGGDGQSTFELAQYMGTVSNFVWMMCLGNAVQLLQLTRYGTVWTIILGLNTLVLLMAVCKFPETLLHLTPLVLREADDQQISNRAEKADDSSEPTIVSPNLSDSKEAAPEPAKEKKEGAIARVWHEVSSYASLISDYRARRYLVCKFWEGSYVNSWNALVPVQLMAWHGWSQQKVVIVFFLVQPLYVLCMPLYGKFQDRVGIKNAYLAGIAITSGGFCTCCGGMLLPSGIGDKVLLVGLVIHILSSGWHAMRGFIDSRFCDKEHVSRFINAQWILGYLQAMFLGPMYASIFNASGETILDKGRANLVMLCCVVINLSTVFCLIWYMPCGEGFGVTLDQLRDGSRCIDRIFDLLEMKIPNLGKSDPNGPQDHWMLGKELWEQMGYREIFWGLPIEGLGGPYWNRGHMGMALNQHNSGPKQMAQIIEKLEEAVVRTELWAGVRKGDTEPAAEGKKKA